MSKEVSKSIKFSDSNLNVLEDVLSTIRFRGNIFFRSQLSAPWGFVFEQVSSPRFHISLNGSFFIGATPDTNTYVQHMDIAMIPHGDIHWIADKSDSQRIPSENAEIACDIGNPLFQHGPITNKLICGIIHYEKDMLHPVIDSLPAIIHFTQIESNDPIWMTVVMIDTIMKDDFSSHSSIIDRLTEVLFMQLLNKYISENIETTGFFAALKNKRIHKILSIIHKYPHIQWSLEQLGDEVGMSRSTLIRQFKTTLGITPITYIKNWRMMKAYYLIKNSSKTLEQIAEQIGFSTARTLNKAFLKHYDFTPSELRKKTSSHG